MVVGFCVTCGVYLCDFCWTSFHNDEVPTLPPCIGKKVGLANCRVLRFDTVLPAATSPVRAQRRTRSNAESSPSRAASAAKIIGRKLLLRAANKPDRLMTDSPTDTMPKSPLRGVRQIKERVVKRRGPGLLAVNRPGGRGRKRKGEEKRTATSVMAAVSRGRRGAAAKRKNSEPSARATKKHKKPDGGEGPACC